MNRTYKVIWSKARHCYVVVSELTKSQHKSSSKSELISTNVHRGGVLGKAAVAAIVAGLLTFGGVAYSPVLADTAKNPAGSGSGVAIGTGSNAPKEENVAIGKGAGISYSNGASTATGDIVVGSGANINNYASQGGSIAIGKNAKVENMAGGGEASFAFGQTSFSGTWLSSSRIPADPSKVVGSIAIGDNTFARTGSTMIGSHNYKGELGDTTVDSTSTRTYALNVYATTVGANSFSNGAFTTNTGSYNIISSEYNGGRSANPVKNMGATITGALNSIESIGADYYSGIANTVSGIANRTSNSNGTLIYGAGNEVTNSITSLEDIPTDSGNSAKAFSEKLRDTIKASNSGGATLAIGGGNKIDHTVRSQAIGVNNTLTGNLYHKDGLSFFGIPDVNEYSAQYNMVDGYNNNVANVNHAYVIGANNNIQGKTFSDATKDGVLSETDREKAKKDDNLIVIGDNHTMDKDVKNNIAIGSADKALTTKVSNAVLLGHNADVQKDWGVALGDSSVATTDKGAVGYDPKGEDHSADITGTWKSTLAAASVGDSANKLTRQITNVAAGTEDTDAVNVAQLKQARTKYYSVNEKTPNVFGDAAKEYAQYLNDDNKGAKEFAGLAAGYMTYAGGIASTVTGSFSGIMNEAAQPGSNDFRGAAALSYGMFNLNDNTSASQPFSGVANSIVGQANVTTDSNAAMVYGAGNSVTNSYRAIDVQKAGAIMQGLKDPKQLNEALKAAVPTSGAQVMVMGGGNTVDKAYMTQVVGVGNTVTGSDKEYVEGTSTQLNYVDGFYNKVENGKNDYVIGSHNTLTSSSVDTNKSNLVLGDNHKLTDRTNNVILGSADDELTTSASDAVLIGHNADVKVDGGVALGSGSVASTDKDVEGYDPLKKGASESDDKAWQSSWAAVSVGDGTHTRQITGVAAGFADTDAVNVAQLKSVATLPVHIYSGGKGSSDSYTAGSPVATPTISSLQFDFGDGLKAEEVGAEGDKRVLVSLDKDALKGDPDFKGDKGDKGDTGAQGEQGPKGEKGDTGAQGEQGPKGDKGDKGDTGAQGEQGPKGEKGDTGAQGEQGPKGDKGDKGDTGAQGEQGPKGEKGDTGAQGEQGPKGDKGDKGDTGAPGKDGKDGKDGGVGTVVGDDTNITVANTETDATKPANYKVSLNKAITVDKVTAGDTTISSNGVSIAGGPSMTKDGIDAAGKKITNVAAGTETTDAVNYGQLKDVESKVDSNTQNIYHMDNRISNLDNRVNKVGAGAAALAALHPLDFDPDDKWDFAVGYGNYRNANSVALGAFYRPNEDTMFSLGTNFGNGENMFNAGLSFKIGQGSGITTSKTAMAKKIESLENTVDQQDKKIAELEALVKEQGEMIRQYVGKK